MRKKFALYIFVILYLFCINVNTVHAEDCVSLKTQIDNYDAYTELLSTLDCTNDGDLSNVATCNEINVKKNVVVTKILKAQDEKKVCSNEQSRVDQIIEDNKNKCSKIFDDSFTNFVNGVMVVFYILGPILLLLFGSLDFAKATASAEEDALKKASTKFVKRLVATFLLYATPTIINLILSFNMTDKYLSGNAYSCDYKYLVYNKKYILKYTPKNNNSTSPKRNCGGDILTSAEKIHGKFECKSQYSDASPNGECWNYSSDGLKSTAEDALNNPNKVVVCATFVSLVLYDSGYLSNDEFTNSTSGLESILKNKGWKAITNPNDMQAGDIMIQSDMSGDDDRGHIQIYAGNDMVYNAGGKSSVQKGAPYTSSDWRSRFTIGYRAPNTSTNCTSGNYIWAVGSTHNQVGNFFGPRVPIGYPQASKNHNGIDFGVSDNANIYAIADGTITSAYYSESGGNMVTLEVTESNGTVMDYIFMHNNKFNVHVGQNVKQGDVIAYAGSTGHSTGTHCHLRAYNVTTGLYVNPLLYAYGGTTNISAIDESTNKYVDINLDVTPGSWSAAAGTKWDSYYDCSDIYCSRYNVGKK